MPRFFSDKGGNFFDGEPNESMSNKDKIINIFQIINIFLMIVILSLLIGSISLYSIAKERKVAQQSAELLE